jgi:cytosine/uracil/thiamine/allantoin permease
MMPWKLMSTFGSYIFGWLIGYSGLLGPVAGIMVADYFLIRGTARIQLRCIAAVVHMSTRAVSIRGRFLRWSLAWWLR